MTERLTRPHKPTGKAAGDKLRRNEIYPIVDEIPRVDTTISLERLAAKVMVVQGAGCMQTVISRYNHNRRSGVPVAVPPNDEMR